MPNKSTYVQMLYSDHIIFKKKKKSQDLGKYTSNTTSLTGGYIYRRRKRDMHSLYKYETGLKYKNGHQC